MPSLGGDQYKWYCEIPPLAEPGNYPGGVKTKPPFEMGVDDFEKDQTFMKCSDEYFIEIRTLKIA